MIKFTHPTAPPDRAIDARIALGIENAEFGYSARIVMRVDQFKLRNGERLGLVGASGSGKTTLLSAISGATEPLRGKIQFDGRLEDRNWRVQNVSRTLQAFPLLHWLTVRGNLELACKVRKVPTARVDEVLAQLSASHIANSFPRNLSGGERCRASLAQAIVGQPKLLLLDEPFNGLDFLVKEDVVNSMLAYAARSDMGVLLVTHDIRDAADLCDHIIVLGEKPITRIVAEVAGRQPNSAGAIEAALRAVA